MTPIDWEPLRKYREPEVTCRCGEVYRSHAKGAVSANGAYTMFVERPCPRCGSTTNPARVAHDAELWSFGGPR